LAFLFHGIRRLVDDKYRKACNSFGRKVDFFWALRYEANRYFHKNLLFTVPDGLEVTLLTVEIGIADCCARPLDRSL
jgi:hypothetical protein